MPRPVAAPADTASLYVRLSREAAAENLSREGMEADCRALAVREGLTVVAVHIDDGISGAVRNRPAFMAWLDDAKEARADTLIAWHTDRMTREGINVAAMILDAIEGKDTETGKVTRVPARLLDTKGLDSRGDEEAFRFRFAIAAEVARAERRRMSDRTKANKRRTMASGRWIGGAPPFGFVAVDNPSGPGRVLVQEPAEAAFIVEAASRVLAGESLMSVVRWANGPHGLPPRRAAAWARATLRQTLTGHPVAGHVMRRVRAGDPSEVVPVLDETGTPVTLPAILTPDESAAVRAALAPKRDDRKRGGRQPSRLLSGLVRCSGCGSRLLVARPNGKTINYRCTTGKESGLCPRPVQVNAETLEEYVSASFLAAHGDRPAMVRRATVTGAADVEAADAEHAAALSALSVAATPEAFARLQAAQAAREAALAVPQETAVRLVSTGYTVREEWDAAEVPERRAMLAANYADIRVLPVPAGTWGASRRQGVDPRRVLLTAQPPYASTDPADGLPLRRAVVEAPELDGLEDEDGTTVYALSR